MGPWKPDLIWYCAAKSMTFFSGRDAAEVRGGGPDVVDQLFLDEGLVVPHGVEDLADRQRGGGVLADQAQRLLVLGRGAVLEPEQVVRLQGLAQLGGLDRGHPVVPVVQQRHLRAELVAHRLEHGRQVAQVGAGVPVLLHRERAAAGGLVVVPLPRCLGLGRDAVDGLDARDGGLDADRLVAQLQVLADRVEQRGQCPRRRRGRRPADRSGTPPRAAGRPACRRPCP